MAAGSTVVDPGRRAAARRRTCARTCKTITFGDERATWRCARRATDGEVLIGAHGREIALRPSFAQAHNLLQPARRGRGGAGAGGRPAGPPGRALLGAARRAPRAAGRGGRDRRLLQRQPDVHARGDRRPGQRRPPRAAWRCSATCSSSGAEAPRLHREIGAVRRRARRRRAGHGRPAGGGDAQGVRGRVLRRRPTRRRPPSCWRRCCAKATRCS